MDSSSCAETIAAGLARFPAINLVHSMGSLVARGACQQTKQAYHALAGGEKIVFLGTPHHSCAAGG
jgi:triacylglycerol esterase/lipase EstA (alpha/beta hydrolase family)